LLDFDDDDALNELEKLGPLPSTAQSSVNSSSMDPLAQQPTNVHTVMLFLIFWFFLMDDYLFSMNYSMTNGGPSSVGPGGPSGQQSAAAHSYSNTGAQPTSMASAQQHGVPPQQSSGQPSVLQELLLNPSNQNNQALNSPRPQYANQYQTRSPMTSGANMVSPGSAQPNPIVSSGQMGPRSMRPTQMYSSHVEMQSVQPNNASGMVHPSQSTYVPSQMMVSHSGPQPLPMNYVYQQSGPQRPMYANRASASQSSMGRGSGMVMNGNGSHPRMRGAHPGFGFCFGFFMVV
uniref:Mastermind-like 2 n=1 Tax=Syphacia muris TaxID=451379 RepID=A0A0N5AVH4_9BILA